MANYLYISIVISCVALTLIKLGKGTSNANYYLSFFAIAAWFIPYSLLAQLVPQTVLAEPIILAFSQLSSAANAYNEHQNLLDIDFWLNSIFGSLIGIGIIVFITRIIDSIKWRRHILNDPSLTLLDALSTSHQIPIYSSTQTSSGLLLGILNPVIIISQHVENPKHQALIIAHEKQHSKNKDNLRLLLLELTQCLFWWNPLMAKLINLNRFFIETRCDEHASNSYGKANYIEDLATLILSSQHRSQPNVVCGATSNMTNNIARIKLLKEHRKMTLRKKLSYSLIALSAVTTMSWNTLATATSTDKKSSLSSEQKQLGALIDFNINVTNNKQGALADSTDSIVKVWVDFNEKSTLKIGEDITLNFKAKDVGNAVFIEYELVESTQSSPKTIATPKLTVMFDQESTIHIDNSDVSKYAYLIKATTSKAHRPD